MWIVIISVLAMHVMYSYSHMNNFLIENNDIDVEYPINDNELSSYNIAIGNRIRWYDITIWCIIFLSCIMLMWICMWICTWIYDLIDDNRIRRRLMKKRVRVIQQLNTCTQ